MITESVRRSNVEATTHPFAFFARWIQTKSDVTRTIVHFIEPVTHIFSKPEYDGAWRLRLVYLVEITTTRLHQVVVLRRY